VRSPRRRLTAGACPRLEALILNNTGMGPLAALRLAHAIETRALLRLERLDVETCEIDVAGATALAAAIRAGGLPELRWGQFSWGRFGRDPQDALQTAMEVGCPRIIRRSLWLYLRPEFEFH
jgi:hypothetical protein